MKKRASFTLLEFLLSLSLFSIICTSLLFWYSTLHIELNKEGRELVKVHLEKEFHRHLAKVLAKADQKVFYTKTGGGETRGTSLIFTFDHGPNLEPLLSDSVLGRIYLDKEKNSLFLAIWPWDEKEVLVTPSEKLLLLEDVVDIRFSFFSPPDLFKKPVDPEKVGEVRPKEGWQREWIPGYNTLPALVKIAIKKEGDKDWQKFGYSLDSKIHPPKLIKTKGVLS